MVIPLDFELFIFADPFFDWTFDGGLIGAFVFTLDLGLILALGLAFAVTFDFGFTFAFGFFFDLTVLPLLDFNFVAFGEFVLVLMGLFDVAVVLDFILVLGLVLVLVF